MATRLRKGSTGDSEVASTSRLIAPIELPTKYAGPVPSSSHPGNVPDPHAAAVVEVDDFRRSSESQHVRRQHAITRCQRGYRFLPADFGAYSELPAVQQVTGSPSPASR